jgi:type II secretory pathway pseudopilin PulG
MNRTVRKNDRRKADRRAGFTLVELLVAMGASTIVLGALAVATVGLARSFNAMEMYSRNQSASVRIMDAMTMDLRRAVTISTTTSTSPNPNAAGNVTVKFAYSPNNAAANVKPIFDGTFDPLNNIVGGRSNPSTYLTLRLPGFYQENDPTVIGYRAPTPLISSGNSVGYGTSIGLAADVTVQYRKAYHPGHRSECFIRREAGVDRVIATHAEYLDVSLTAQNDGVFLVQTSFVPTFSSARTTTVLRVGSSDRVMLRNPRRD